MSRSLATLSARLALLVALGAGVLGADTESCGVSCESQCLDQYDDCLARSPPGASKSDCSAQHQRCMDACAASHELTGDDPSR